MCFVRSCVLAFARNVHCQRRICNLFATPLRTIFPRMRDRTRQASTAPDLLFNIWNVQFMRTGHRHKHVEREHRSSCMPLNWWHILMQFEMNARSRSMSWQWCVLLSIIFIDFHHVQIEWNQYLHWTSTWNRMWTQAVCTSQRTDWRRNR